MTNINATNFRKNVFSLLEQTVKYNEPVNISTKDGNAVLLSEADYNNVMATFEIYSNPALYEKLMHGRNTPLDRSVPGEEVKW